MHARPQIRFAMLKLRQLESGEVSFDHQLLRQAWVEQGYPLAELDNADVAKICGFIGRWYYEYLREGGGKRIRPSLLLLASHMLGYSGPSAIRLGSVVEMVHTATLVHDDIIDGADTRRGRPSANTTWGNEKCVLAGDWLYMQTFKVALEEKNLRVLELLIGLTQQMVEGELLQIQKLGKAVSEAEYYDLIFRKTACLFSVCMRLGAILGGASPEQEEAAGAYGRNLGMAFQIVDDVLDLTAS